MPLARQNRRGRIAAMNELFEAAKALLPLLSEEDELDPIAHLKRHMNETPAQRLRREADEIEARERAIERLRAAVKAYGER